MIRWLVAIACLALLASGCSDAAEPPPDSAVTNLADDQVVLEWNEFGGCQRMIDVNNCAQWTVTADGSVAGLIPGGGPFEEVTASGSVAASLVEDWLAVAAATDFAVVLAAAGPGPCEPAADGVGIQFVAPLIDVRSDSCGANVRADEPGLRELVALGTAAQAAAPLR